MASARTLLFLPVLLLAQDARQDPQEVRIRSGPYLPTATLAVQTNLVEVGVTVRNRQRHPVAGLQAVDFELTDSGKLQQSHCSPRSGHRASQSSTTATASSAPAATPAPDARPPHFIVLFFDDTHTESMALQKGREAAKRFIRDGLQPGDRVAIFTGSGSPVADFTTDSQALSGVLDQLKPHPEIGVHGVSSCPTLTPYQAYAIMRGLDAKAKDAAVEEVVRCLQCETVECRVTIPVKVQTAAEVAWSQFRPQSESLLDRLSFVIRRLAAAPGSRVLMLISPGFISGTLEQQCSGLMDAALRARIVINSLDSVGLSTSPMQGMQRVVLNEFLASAATATGGQFIQNSNDLSGGIRALTEPAEASYILGFSPAGEPDEKYHALKVRLKSSELRAESRPGYFSTRVSEKPPETVQQRIDRLAASKETVEQFAASVQFSSEEKDGRTLIHVDIAVAAKELKFLEKDGRHAQELTFVTMILDSSGSLIEGKQAVMSLALTPGTLADLRERGIPVATSFSIPKGAYQVREVIREAVENRMVAKTTAVK